MIALTLAEIARAVEGTLVGGDPDALVTGPVEHDSRKIVPGGLFFAFPGEKVDGHDFAPVAVERGAVAVVGQRPVDAPTIVVDDPLRAIGLLATHVAPRLGATIVGVTGSSGKTTTKDLIAQLVAELGPTIAPAGSLNNELGHPSTVLRADADTRFLVLEYSARHIGDIDYLCRIAGPRIAAVLNVGTSHIGEFGSQDNIATAKGELVEALPDTGLAILNADDPRVRAMAPRTRARVVLVGEAADADVRAADVTVDERGRAAFTLVTPEGDVRVALGVAGRHQVGNVLVAAAVGRELGMTPAQLGDILPRLRLVSARRMDVFDRRDGVTVIDDSYNANPASMAAAVRALADMGGSGKRRCWAVLGYMAELGAEEVPGHRSVGRLAAELGVDRLVAVGDGAGPLADGAEEVADWAGEAVRVTDQEAAIALLGGALRPGDVVLVKGSRYRTWQVADALREGLSA
ncbi:UDP-N-acetylmuramoyl-tripeptide--D-alanyl-D-alanine ligase [Longispora fulva]|uniref:UDP-N-acetylmuramoyl-tripeptide--D-alanyl-D-alanine ligase n=1 Tax=Longispora fulva TaxID=619741 RepID=A0A8J7GNP4_9ACTN|nr:UDP-N-acetylmuramoyl-tripeptide--D-alanyl-D-alanine ligase [Longispora fulva]MBG6141190.1 UDP-N-acetylmuramoyl-tripeptide--D-alanyl-D-alanine ligase [Longispora fulva]GIG62814.1 UDP-N-acetylmuramoyl-tripeptide--D-alanyl-D-alanine ligase [Longispora fulva]